MRIEANIQLFIEGYGQTKGLQPTERDVSFDYCFNYFQQFKEKRLIAKLANPESIELSCLQLGFYLASWGMLRGSTFLYKKSIKFYEPLIRYIASAPLELWEIDANCYTPANIKLLFDCKQRIEETLSPCHVTDTLATKIMLGVFGNVPAFDSSSTIGFRKELGESSFKKPALEKIQTFYESNQIIIDKHCIPTLDYATGQPTNRYYTRAKVIDMVFWIEGSNIMKTKGYLHNGFFQRKVEK